MNDLRQRCIEILQWQRTGVLEGHALQKYAETKWYADEHDKFRMAEADTAKEAYAFVVQHEKENLKEENRLLKDALKQMLEEFRQLDLPYGSEAYANAISVMNRVCKHD